MAMTRTLLEGWSDSTLLSELCLPGTHDSLTYDCPRPGLRCQDATLEQQLSLGVRYIDLRLTESMFAAHGDWVSQVSGREVIETIADYLCRNSSETVLLRIQNAADTQDNEEAYQEALTTLVAPYQDLFWPVADPEQTQWPTLGECRGKIVALQCSRPRWGRPLLSGQVWAADWHDNKSIALQDDYDKPPFNRKIDAIAAFLPLETFSSGTLVLNHLSYTGCPRENAQRVNAVITSDFVPQPWRGVVIADFITPDLSARIWNANC